MLVHLCVLVDDNAAALLPCGKQDTAVAALVVDVLQAVDQIGYAAETETCAEDEGPDTVQRVSQSTHEAEVVVVGRTGWYFRPRIQASSRLADGRRGSRLALELHSSCLMASQSGTSMAVFASVAQALAALAAASSGRPAAQ